MSIFTYGWFWLNRPHLVFERIMRDNGRPIDVMRFLQDALSVGEVEVVRHL
jgi:hypothetical protein